MLELNRWFFVLLANFLILLFLLNIILFKPLMQLFRERKNVVDESLKSAETLKMKKDSLFSQMQSEIAGARDRAREKYLALRHDGLNEQKAILQTAHQKAVAMIEEAQKNIRNESARARETLKSEVEKYSEEIVNKLLKV